MSIKRNIEDLSSAITEAHDKIGDALQEWQCHLLPDIEEMIRENEALKDRVAVLEKELAALRKEGE